MNSQPLQLSACQSGPASEEATEPEQYCVIIPAWNESELIESAVSSVINAIQAQTLSGAVIVVDNNSTDDTASKATQAGATVVFEPVNQIARARNAGARASNANWLLFMDADTTLSPALLTLALDALTSGNAIGGGSTIVPDIPISGFGRRLLAFWNWVSVKTRTAAGCFIYCERDAFIILGGFSEKVYAGEELSFSRKIKKLAKQNGGSKEFVIHTEAPVVTSSRKLDWYSPVQMIVQFIILLIPGSTYSRRLCHMWYDRSGIKSK